MRKKMIVTLMTMTLLVSVSSQESVPQKDSRFLMSWSMGYDGHPDVFSRTSVLGIGFILFSNDKAEIRNQIEFCNGTMMMEEPDVKYYKKTLTNKFSFGRLSRNGLFRSYGFLEGRVGTCGEELYKMFDNALIWNLGVGTGLDINVTEKTGFFLELRFMGNIYQGELIPQQGFDLGMIYHF